MAGLNFPDAPVLNQQYAAATTVWSWDGNKWISAGAGSSGGGSAAGRIVVGVSTILPAGFTGMVQVENTAAAPITITLPPAPTAGQQITLKDCAGNTSAYPATINGNDKFIEGAMTLVLNFDFSWVDLYYTGVQWVQV